MFFLISVSITVHTIFIFNICVSCLTTTFTLAKVGIKSFLLTIFKELVSSWIFVSLLIRSSSFLATQTISFPGVSLICRNILTRVYRFIINEITKSLNFFDKEKNHVIIFRLLYIWSSLSRGHHQGDRILYSHNKILKVKNLPSFTKLL